MQTIKFWFLSCLYIVLSLTGFSQNAINPKFVAAPGTYKIENGKEIVEIPFEINNMEIEIKAEMNEKKSIS